MFLVCYYGEILKLTFVLYREFYYFVNCSSHFSFAHFSFRLGVVVLFFVLSCHGIFIILVSYFGVTIKLAFVLYCDMNRISFLFLLLSSFPVRMNIYVFGFPNLQ